MLREKDINTLTLADISSPRLKLEDKLNLLNRQDMLREIEDGEVRVISALVEVKPDLRKEIVIDAVEVLLKPEVGDFKKIRALLDSGAGASVGCVKYHTGGAKIRSGDETHMQVPAVLTASGIVLQ